MTFVCPSLARVSSCLLSCLSGLTETKSLRISCDDRVHVPLCGRVTCSVGCMFFAPRSFYLRINIEPHALLGSQSLGRNWWCLFLSLSFFFFFFATKRAIFPESRQTRSTTISRRDSRHTRNLDKVKTAYLWHAI